MKVLEDLLAGHESVVLQQDIALYSTNYIHFRNGAMPQLVLGNKLMAGTFRSADDLFKVLEQEFGLRREAGPSAKSATSGKAGGLR